MGSRVHVVRVEGRRALIDQPVDGWCSMKSSRGDVILQKVPKDDKGEDSAIPASPRVEQDIQEEITELKTKLSSMPGLAQERDKARQNLEKTESELQMLHKKTQEQKSKIEELERQRNLGASEKKSQMIRLQQLEKIAKEKELENQRLKEKVGSMAQGYTPGVDNSDKTIMQNGDVALMTNGDVVIVRYYGNVHWSEEEHIGVEFSDPIGKIDGECKGKRYFTCAKNHGE
eukprot:UN33528